MVSYVDWLNYHHLLYFWTVAKEGTIAAACERLHLAQPTISTQIRALETALGEKLFRRSGRYLVLTDAGQLVFRYADGIFSLGREMLDTLKGRPTGQPVRFNVGLADVLPKLVAYRLLEPAFKLREPIQLVCHESTPAGLLAKLAIHELDLILSDNPVNPQSKVRAFSHLLGECGVAIFGAKRLATRYRPGFPNSINGAPFLLPARDTALRRSLDLWFETHRIRPTIIGEFDDTALLEVFGRTGAGLFAAPDVVARDIRLHYGAGIVGRPKSLRERFYAISVERIVKHPAVVAITSAARDEIFG